MKETTKISDNELITRYVNGDLRSIEILVSRYKVRVYSYISMIIDDKFVADDIFQDTFIKAIQMLRMGSYKEEGKFYHWITTIAHNLIIDMFRKEKRKGIPVSSNVDIENVFDNDESYELSIEDKLISQHNSEQLNTLIDMLPEEQSEVIKLRHYCDLSFKDISLLTNVSINTALGRMRYAIINLRKLIEENNISLQQ